MRESSMRLVRRLNLQVRRAVRRYRDGFGRQKWVTVVMTQAVSAFMDALPVAALTCIEVSGDLHRGRGWASYRSTSFPDFDLCMPPAISEAYDVVVCEQVLEHVLDPIAAMRTLRELARPGGRLIITTPFLVRVHGHPHDYWRFTENGLVRLIESAGLRVDESHTWGNRSAVRANLWCWRAYRPWHDLRNDPEVPISVWAFCTRPSAREPGGSETT